MSQRTLYYLLQFTGWTAYIVISFLMNTLGGVPFSGDLIFSLISAYVIGIGLSHLYREYIIRQNWLSKGFLGQIPRMLIASVVFAVIYECLYLSFIYFLTDIVKDLNVPLIVEQYLGFFFLFIMWSLIYFFFHMFRNYKNEEIKNLKWEASSKEMELNKLKSQMNPHFIFNSMNTIRALVDEDPIKAKKAITQLSNIIRNNLMMGKIKEIALKEELSIVKDYLDIESARFEERLQTQIEIPKNLLECKIPPLLLQTIVENAIKHGISKLPEGGELTISATEVNQTLILQIKNPGVYTNGKPTETGFGIPNTIERLNLLYEDKASFRIMNQNNHVISEIKIPIS